MAKLQAYQRKPRNCKPTKENQTETTETAAVHHTLPLCQPRMLLQATGHEVCSTVPTSPEATAASGTGPTCQWMRTPSQSQAPTLSGFCYKVSPPPTPHGTARRAPAAASPASDRIDGARASRPWRRARPRVIPPAPGMAGNRCSTILTSSRCRRRRPPDGALPVARSGN
ncbi:hypothetical protein PVAP13_5NG431200 [Panicum virgatum]|uniref:Uncharacterized protein n=1 Tax=Panicum virgatum TaxID=38727 RepID=A0A8T0RYV5_PANVG|nr:hypothetical protein PVAP13_5NG431200 [Panicum virgatum]